MEALPLSSLRGPGPGRAARLFADGPAGLDGAFGRRSFLFRHRLVESGLFTIPRLMRAAEHLLRSGREFRLVARQAQQRIDTRFDQAPLRERVAAAFLDLESSNSWVKLNNVGDVDGDYAALLDDCVDEISNLAGRDLRRDLTLAQFTVFCASPGSVTPFHIDHETNFLCQVAGEKEVCLWDPRDRSVVSERDLERFYTGEINAARYRDEFELKGQRYELRPGYGVHQPPNAPHWVRTGANVAISVSVNLCHRDIDRRAHAFQVNHLLRKAGLQPRPPGERAWVDRLKALPLTMLGTSRPRSADDVVFSGLARLRAPLYRVLGTK